MTFEITVTVLLLIAFVCLMLAAFNAGFLPRVHFGWLGVAIIVLVTLIERGLFS